MSPLVSVIMPAYNAERYIAESINSVCAQTYPDWELIVIDDGSTDNTASVVRRLATADTRIHLITQPNGGPARARNAGIAVARGDLVAFLDSDDLWVPHKLTAQIVAIDSEAVDLVFSDGWIFPEDEVAAETQSFWMVAGRFSGAEMFRLGFAGNRISVLSVLARRDALARVGFFDEDVRVSSCEDYDLWMRLAENGAAFYGMSDKLVRYRLRSGSLSHRDSLDPSLAAIIHPEKSQSLKASIVLLKKHEHRGLVAPQQVRQRFHSLYRALVAAALAEGDIVAAQAYAKESLPYDRGGLKPHTWHLLIRIAPRYYNPLRLYIHRARLLFHKVRAFSV